MGISFLGALGYGGGGFIDGMNEYEKRQQAQMENEQRGRDLDAQTAYGNALTGAQGSWAQQPNSIWQRLAGLFGQAQEEQRNPMGATALPEGVQPVQQEQNSFDRIGNMLRQEMGGGPAPMPQAQGAPPNMPQGPMGAATPMPQAQPMQPQMGGGQLMPGRMSLPDIAQRVAAANPGAPPHVIAGAIDRFRPWMSDEAKIQWQQAQLTLREAQLQQRENNAQQRFTQNERRIDQGDERLAQQGETSRRRLEQGDRRLGIQEEQGNRRLTTGETNAETRRRGQENTADYRTQRLGQIERQIEQRGQQMAAVEQRFQQRMANAKDEKDRAAAIREYEQAWKQYSEATGRIIQAQSAAMSAQERSQLLSGVTKQREEAMRKLEQFRGQPSNVYSPRIGNTSMPTQLSQPATTEEEAAQGKVERSQTVQGARRQEQGGKSTMRAEPQQPAQAGPPPQALQSLKEGIVTTFANGQRWTLRNGKPEQVQ